MAGFGGKGSAGTLSKAEYLKRYLGGGPIGVEETKKRRKKKNHGQVPCKPGVGRGMRIVDDDYVGWKDPARKQADAADEDDLPVVAEFVDERPKEIKLMEEFRSGNKWKVLRDDWDDSQGSERSMADKHTSTSSSDARLRNKEIEEAGHSPITRMTPQDSNEYSQSLAVLDTSPASSPRQRQRHDSSVSSSPVRERLDSPELQQHRRRRHDSPDQSPPRKGRPDLPDQLPLRTGRHDSPDQSPLRKGCHDSPDQSTLKKGYHDSPDLSPTRKKYAASPDISPPRKSWRTSPGLSPSRTERLVDTGNKLLASKTGKSSKMLIKNCSSPSPRKDSSSSDLSPPRNKRHDSDSDLSPRRKKQTSNEKKSQDSQVLSTSPKRLPQANNSTSPPARRRIVRPASDSDLSPPRNRGKTGAANRSSDSDLSPPRKTLRKSSDSDLSPARRTPATKRSPPRRGDGPQMLSGGMAGLVSADVLRKEKKDSKQKEHENKPLEEESKTAATVFRDKHGRKRDLQAEREEQRRTAGVKSQRDEQYAEWGQGLAQRQMQQQNVLDAAREIEKPLARYIDDHDLDQMLRDQERDGDPMANFIKKKKVKEEKNKKARPRYNGPEPPPNRFNILPGHRWDGVDRSNGFEQKRFARQSDKKAVQDLAYKWSVEDM